MKKQIVILAIIVLSASIAFASSIHKNEFYIDLPENWVEIPQSEIQNYISELSDMAPEVGKPQCTYAFQIEGDHWFNEPFMTIHVDNSGRVSKQEYEKITKRSLGSALNNNLGAYIDEIKAKAGTPIYDKDRNILWTAVEISPDPPIVIASAIFLTNKGMITFSSGCASHKVLEKFVQIIGSVALKPELQYKSRLIDSIPFINRLNWKSIGSGIIFILIYFLVINPNNKKS
ncbi:MAG: hypothetical protein EOM20_04765 [Spartobacteria bacterium]|nr:hypothetical protein [Spartobacteria bacterium]